MTKRDYYVVLEVERGSTHDEIKVAYRKLAMRYHPDRNPDDPSAEDAFKEATEAYSVLSDGDRRKRYDRLGHAAFDNSGPGFDPTDFGAVSEILEGLFGEVFGGGRKRRQSARDLKYNLEVSFVEAALGAEKSITVERPGPCLRCEGTGAKPGTPIHTCNVCQGRGQVKYQRGFFAAARPCHACAGKGKKIPTACNECKGTGNRHRPEQMKVKVPPGTQDGAVRTVRGGGEHTHHGIGDLHIQIQVTEHPLFQREGADIVCAMPITFPEAVLGASIEVPTLEGKVVMKVPSGTQSGKVFRLRGKGLPVYGGYAKGDQLVTVIVEIPEKITRRQRKLIQELAEEQEGDSHPRRASFLGKLKSLLD